MFKLKRIVMAAAWLMASAAIAAVDINTASENDLDSIKGIGPSTAAKMMTARKQSPFKDWSDLIQRLGGIGEKRATKLSAEGLTVNGMSYKPGTGTSAKADSLSTSNHGTKRSLPIAIAPRY